MVGEIGGAGSIALNVTSVTEPRMRAVIECCATVHILAAQRENLDRIGEDLLKTFTGKILYFDIIILIFLRLKIWKCQFKKL